MKILISQKMEICSRRHLHVTRISAIIICLGLLILIHIFLQSVTFGSIRRGSSWIYWIDSKIYDDSHNTKKPQNSIPHNWRYPSKQLSTPRTQRVKGARIGYQTEGKSLLNIMLLFHHIHGYALKCCDLTHCKWS